MMKILFFKITGEDLAESFGSALQCRENGQVCLFPSDCCSTYCAFEERSKFGSCQYEPAERPQHVLQCKGVDEECFDHPECCSNNCDQGFCR